MITCINIKGKIIIKQKQIQIYIYKYEYATINKNRARFIVCDQNIYSVGNGGLHLYIVYEIKKNNISVIH